MNSPPHKGCDDLRLAREAAAQANADQGYPMLTQAYLEGAWDNDTEVRSALIAIRLARQAESITIQPRDEESA
jgi:hypothetical protein